MERRLLPSWESHRESHPYTAKIPLLGTLPDDYLPVDPAELKAMRDATWKPNPDTWRRVGMRWQLLCKVCIRSSGLTDELIEAVATLEIIPGTRLDQAVAAFKAEVQWKSSRRLVT